MSLAETSLFAEARILHLSKIVQFSTCDCENAIKVTACDACVVGHGRSTQ